MSYHICKHHPLLDQKVYFVKGGCWTKEYDQRTTYETEADANHANNPGVSGDVTQDD